MFAGRTSDKSGRKRQSSFAETREEAARIVFEKDPKAKIASTAKAHRQEGGEWFDTGNDIRWVRREELSKNPRRVSRVKRNPRKKTSREKLNDLGYLPRQFFLLKGMPSGPKFKLIKRYVSKAGIDTVWGVTYPDEKRQTVARYVDVNWVS